MALTGKSGTKSTTTTVSGRAQNSAKQLIGVTPPLVERACGVCSKAPLGRRLYRKLKVYAGDKHPHAAQQPKPLEIK